MSIKTLLLAGLTVGALGTAAAADPYTYAPADTYSYEPAPGTYQNGYVWVAGAYEWIDGTQVFVPAHWQLAEPTPQPNIVVRTGWREPRFERRFEHRFERHFDRDRGFERGRTARSYRRGSRY
jgi:hypothetical protein